jgi:hypothetical protein
MLRLPMPIIGRAQEILQQRQTIQARRLRHSQIAA